MPAAVRQTVITRRAGTRLFASMGWNPFRDTPADIDEQRNSGIDILVK